MKTLGIETASDICSVALVENGVLVAERSMAGRQIHSEHLLSMVDLLLSENALTAAGVDLIAISIGPGSFTGLRIGLSTAKGLAYAASKSITAVPTLEALAFNVFRAGSNDDASVVLAMLDSRRGECFAGCYAQNAELFETVIPAGSYTYSELAAHIVEQQDKLTGCRLTGPGAERFLQSYPGMDLKMKLMTVAERNCSAAAIALLGERQYKIGNLADVAELEPNYMKDFFTTAVLQTIN
jgi:tRNA threonylcarbamoyladenosine biosynthesis protein TsaB